jgi:hypothetical protein
MQLYIELEAASILSWKSCLAVVCISQSAATKLTTCSESTVHETKSYEIIQPFFSYLILLGNQPAILTHIRWHATTQSSSDCWISNKKLSSRVATKTVRHLWMVEHAYSWLSRKRFIQPHMETTRRCIQNSSRYRSCRWSSKQNLNRFSFSLSSTTNGQKVHLRMKQEWLAQEHIKIARTILMNSLRNCM